MMCPNCSYPTAVNKASSRNYSLPNSKSSGHTNLASPPPSPPATALSPNWKCSYAKSSAARDTKTDPDRPKTSLAECPNGSADCGKPEKGGTRSVKVYKRVGCTMMAWATSSTISREKLEGGKVRGKERGRIWLGRSRSEGGSRRALRHHLSRVRRGQEVWRRNLAIWASDTARPHRLRHREHLRPRTLPTPRRLNKHLRQLSHRHHRPSRCRQ